MMKFWVIGLVAFCSILGAVGQIFFKLASKDLAFNVIALLGNWKLILGLSLYGVASILFIVALRHGNVSVLYPIIALSYVWVTILSTLFLGEVFPAYKWAGIAFILLGVVIIVK